MDKYSPEPEVSQFKSPNDVEEVKTSRWQGFVDSFRSAELSEYDMANMTEAEVLAARTARSPLARKLKSRHLQMIAIGGSIGTGLFIGSGAALASGGPAALLIGFGIISVMLYCMMQALGELAVVFPVSGAFSTYTSRFIHPSVGFAIGWNYAIQWLIIPPLEIIAASITIEFFGSDINPVAWVAIFYVFIVGINIFGVKGYAEAEFVFSLIKVVAVIGFIIVGIIINVGGIPGGNGYLGGQFWQDPGAFNNGFKGVCSVFVNAAFSFAGTELAGLAAAETANPRKAIPRACKQVFWRIMLFYMVSLTVVGLIVPFTDKRLLGSSSVDITASPFVIAINNAGIDVLPYIMNAVILIAVLSVGNAGVFGCSRTMCALAEQGFAPKIIGYVDRSGRPMVAIGITSVFALLCFMSGSEKQGEVFNWLYALASLSLLFTWLSVGWAHIRFRRALKAQGIPLATLPFKAPTGVIGSYICVILNALVLIACFWTSLWPIGGEPDPAYFFQQYLAAPVVLFFLIFHLVWKRPKWTRSKDLDVMTGRRDVDLDLLQQELEEERQYIRSRAWWYRTYRFWC